MVKKTKVDLTPLTRFLEVLPKSGDKELTLLKSHLVIEEVLTEIICKKIGGGKYVHDARLSFSQKSKLCRAIDGFDRTKWIWQALKLLNQARNELSHSLTDDEIVLKLNSFEEHVVAHNKSFFDSGENAQFTRFHMAAFATYIPIAAFANFDPANVRIASSLLGVPDA